MVGWRSPCAPGSGALGCRAGRGRLERPEDRESGPPAPPRPTTCPSSRPPGPRSPRRSVRTAGSPARPAATRPGDAGARSPTSPTTPRRSRASARGPPGRHRRPCTPGPGSAPSISWLPLTTTGSRRPLTRTSSTSSSSSRPDITGNTAAGWTRYWLPPISATRPRRVGSAGTRQRRSGSDDPACRVAVTDNRARRKLRPFRHRGWEVGLHAQSSHPPPERVTGNPLRTPAAAGGADAAPGRTWNCGPASIPRP